MLKPALISLTLVALTTAFAPVLQERTKKKEAKDVPALLTDASSAFRSGRYGASTKATIVALGLIGRARHAAVLDSFPALGDDWEARPSEYEEAAVMMMGMAGFNVARESLGPDGARLDLTATMGSPLAAMFAPQLSNPALLGDDAEVIKYGDDRALLKKSGDDRWELTVLLGENIVQANARKMSDDALLKVMSQSAIDAMKAAMAK